MKYIEKDKAYKIVLHYGSYAASAKISDLPSIDLVRCGECKWYDTGIDEDGEAFGKCIGRCYGGVTADWFCAGGERREE